MKSDRLQSVSKFSGKCPTEPGFYWFSAWAGECKPVVVEVAIGRSGRLEIRFTSGVIQDLSEYVHPMDRWRGPLAPQEPADEEPKHEPR